MKEPVLWNIFAHGSSVEGWPSSDSAGYVPFTELTPVSLKLVENDGS